jgi:hypothetical protein
VSTKTLVDTIFDKALSSIKMPRLDAYGRAIGRAGWLAVVRDAVGALERMHFHPGRVQG